MPSCCRLNLRHLIPLIWRLHGFLGPQAMCGYYLVKLTSFKCSMFISTDSNRYLRLLFTQVNVILGCAIVKRTEDGPNLVLHTKLFVDRLRHVFPSVRYPIACSNAVNTVPTRKSTLCAVCGKGFVPAAATRAANSNDPWEAD